MMISEELRELLLSARRAAVLTGAGISKESGIPTFREAQTGLWEKYDPAELATPQAFNQNPQLVWEWYCWRRDLVGAAQPNPGHLALVQMERLFPEFHLITQNVDGLHRQAGSRHVIELHGNITRSKCFERGHPVEAWAEDGRIPPVCPQCGSLLRPDVVWFGESLPADALHDAVDASQNVDVFFSIGTSALVHPAASLPIYARQAGAVIVEVNPDETPLSVTADFILRGAAGEILPELIDQVWKR